MLHRLVGLDFVFPRALNLQTLNIAENGRLVVHKSNDPQGSNHLRFCAKVSCNGPAVFHVLEQLGSSDCDGGEWPEQLRIELPARVHHTFLSFDVRCKRDNGQIEPLTLQSLEILDN